MDIQYGKNTRAELFCFQQNRWRRMALLPWRTPSPASDFVQASFHSEADKARRTDGIEAAVTPDLPVQAPNSLSPVELHALYAGTTVPQHRYLAPALLEAVNSPAIALDPAKWFADLDGIPLLSVVEAWLNTNSNPSFEQLKCVGFDPQTSQLTAVLTIKQSRGYSGGTKTAGSREFVAFWVDWGSGFEYQGTASAAVFDFGSLPASGLEICVGLPVDLSLHAPAEATAARSIKVRAVLSWNTPPSTTHPFAQVVWGNSMDLRIAISSHRTVHSSQEADSLTTPRRGNAAFTFIANDLADRGPTFTKHCSEPVGWVSTSASIE